MDDWGKVKYFFIIFGICFLLSCNNDAELRILHKTADLGFSKGVNVGMKAVMDRLDKKKDWDVIEREQEMCRQNMHIELDKIIWTKN